MLFGSVEVLVCEQTASFYYFIVGVAELVSQYNCTCTLVILSSLSLSSTCTGSCCVCGETPPPPLPPAAPPSVLAVCLLKRYLDGKLLNWRVILNSLPDQVYVHELVKFVSHLSS